VKEISAIAFFLIILVSCNKDPEIISNNDAPYYNEVSTVLIENYVNRLFIDLIGREPLDVEMDQEVLSLKTDSLSEKSRINLIQKLQWNESFIEGDSSYKHAYFHRLYEMIKVRLIEGASKAEIIERRSLFLGYAKTDSIIGDSVGMQKNLYKANKLTRLINAEVEYMNGNISIEEVHAHGLDNSIYDEINMNTFNFLNASFDDLLFRYPTEQEFYQCFDMIEYNLSRILFNKPGQNKGDYIDIITNSSGCYEGLIRWAYITLLAREPADSEINTLLYTFTIDKDFQKIQEFIMISDEYANFN
jgi:hypothetical protein